MQFGFLSSAWASIVGLFTTTSPELPPDPSVCQSSACASAALNLRDSINFSVNPCDNFYEYACGKWATTHKKISEYQDYDTMQWRKQINSAETIAFLKQPDDASEPRSVHTARKLFKSCLDTDTQDLNGLQPLKEMLNLVNLTSTPPILFDKDHFDLLLTTVRMQKWLGIEMFYSVHVGADPFNSTRNLISIVRPDLSKRDSPLPSLSTPFVDEIKHEVELDAIKDVYVSTTFSVLCENSSSELCEKPLTLNHAMLAAFALNRLDKYTRSLQKIKLKPPPDIESFQEVISLKGLQNLSDNLALEKKARPINWTRNMELMFRGVQRANLSLQDDTEILIQRSYVEDILRFIYSFSLADHELGSWWAVVDAFAEYSVSRLRNAKRLFMKTWLGEETRETWCERAVNHLYGSVIGYRYSTKPIYNETKFQVQEITENIRTVFTNLMNKTSWMDEKTKNRALQKLKSMKAFIGFPDPRYNETMSYSEVLDRWFPESDHDLANNFLMFTLSKVKTTMNSVLSMINDVNNDDLLWDDKTFFYMLPPVVVNAFYFPEKNALVIPAGILGTPIHDNGLEALNYGSIGTIIGHEMTHGFDTLGRHYNSFGQLENWWEPETMKMYNERAKCLVDKYDKITASGVQTLSENIADNGGFREALFAYRLYVSKNGPELHLPGFKNYTHEQLFTLAYANTYCENPGILSARTEIFQVHSGSEARVNGVLGNSHEFSRIWNCSAESPMHKKNNDECYVW